MDNKNNNCWSCKHLQKSIYMQLEDDTLYSVWCNKGNIENSTECQYKEEE